MLNRAIRIAALANIALAAPSLAQSIPVPPVRELIDDNGVDLFRGAYTVDETVVSIGGGQGMTYRRIHRGNGWSNNIEAVLQSADGITFLATVNGRTDRFTKSGTVFTPTEATAPPCNTTGSARFIRTGRATAQR